MTAPWRLERGASVLSSGVRFTLWAPRAREVRVRIVAGPGAGTDQPLEPGEGGGFQGVVASAAAGSDYHYLIEGGPPRPDPLSRHQPGGVHGPSRVVDPAAFTWQDAGWQGREMADLVLYELHVGTFSPEGTFDGVLARLGQLAELGVTAIELMPVAEFPGARNWGYDGVALYAPAACYGGPDGLRRLVNAAHRSGIAVLLDVVYNHLGPEGNYLAEFGPYFTERYQTPWGPAMNFDGPGREQVRRYVLDNAQYWITEYHLDGLRLDAVHAIFDASEPHILEELSAEVHRTGAALGRRVQVIAESDLNDPRLVRTREEGGYQLDAVWSDDFHHAVHAALTGERDGYYADFGTVAQVAKAWRDHFVLDGGHSCYRGRRHGAPAHDLPADRFVTFIQNHDQVGNRARGERLGALVPPAARRLAAALLLLAPTVPLLFMGEEFGESSPFLYFVSHGDPALREAVREGRRREFARFTWPGEPPDPNAEETFTRSRLTWRPAGSPHRELLTLYRDLLRIRREEPALRPGDATLTVGGEPAAGWLAASLERPGSRLLSLFNLAERPREMALPTGPSEGWTLRLSTDDPAYGGAGAVAAAAGRLAPGEQWRISLPGYTAALYRTGAAEAGPTA